MTETGISVPRILSQAGTGWRRPNRPPRDRNESGRHDNDNGESGRPAPPPGEVGRLLDRSV